MGIRGQRLRPLTANSSRQKFVPTLTTSTTSIIPKTTRSADQVKSFVRVKSSSRNWASAEIFTTTTFAAALMTQFGMYSTTTPRNDASPARGQWDLDNAYRYVSEAYGGYHLNALHGINVDAGIFMSYVGLFSYYNFDNWAYQPSYVSSNTPWFFNGVRVQIFPDREAEDRAVDHQRLAILRNVQQAPGVGGQILWRPNGSIVDRLEQLLLGTDTLGISRTACASHRQQHSGEILRPARTRFLDKAAFSLTVDAGCEIGWRRQLHGQCGEHPPKQSFLGFMALQPILVSTRTCSA